MNPKPIEQAKSPLLARTLPALLRARKRAEELAAATNTSLVEVIGGKVVHVRPPSPAPRSREVEATWDGLARPPAPRSVP